MHSRMLRSDRIDVKSRLFVVEGLYKSVLRLFKLEIALLAENLKGLGKRKLKTVPKRTDHVVRAVSDGTGQGKIVSVAQVIRPVNEIPLYNSVKKTVLVFIALVVVG